MVQVRYVTWYKHSPTRTDDPQHEANFMNLEELAQNIESIFKSAQAKGLGTDEVKAELLAAVKAMKPLMDCIPWGREVLIRLDGSQEIIYSGMT